MTKRALLIGANYTATPSVQLSGCINDIVNVRNTLIDAYGYQDANIIMLRDDDKTRLPTRKNISYFITQVINSSTANDTLWVHYSGHGTQVRDTNGDEADGFDECIVPCDYNSAGIITDDELFTTIKNAKCQLVLCFDSCHSGTVCDLQYSINYNGSNLTKVVNSASRSIPNPNIVMLSGCTDSQTSADSYSNTAKQGVGAFTQTLLETLRSSDHNIAILPLYTALCANLRAYGFTQIPVLSSSVASPVFQFAKSYSNGAIVTAPSVMPVKTTKDVSSKRELRGRMRDLFMIQ